MTTLLGTGLVVPGVACIVLISILYLLSRHHRHHADLAPWTPAFADKDDSVNSMARRRSSRGIEISESHLATPAGASPSSSPVSVPVLVTGASAQSGVAVVRALVSAGYEVVALDHDGLAPGLRLAQLGAVIPPPSASDFGITLAKVADRTGARSLVPGDGGELRALLAAGDLLSEAGVATWLPSPELIATCSDPRVLSSALSNFSPRTSSELNASRKPRCSLDAPTWRPFEADVLAGVRGSLVAAVPRWRLATSGQQTMAAETFERADVSSLLDQICRFMQLEGPATVTGFVGYDDVVITDFSLGFSSCVALNAAAGADMVVAYTKKLRGECLPDAPMPYRSGVRMVRHLDEVFET